MKFTAQFSTDMVKDYILNNTTHHEPIIELIAQQLYIDKRGGGILGDLWEDDQFIETFYQVHNQLAKKAA